MCITYDNGLICFNVSKETKYGLFSLWEPIIIFEKVFQVSEINLLSVNEDPLLRLISYRKSVLIRAIAKAIDQAET